MRKLLQANKEFISDNGHVPFLLYRGVVEDNNHPDKNGKVRVRIFGIHTEKNENSGEEFEFIASSELPWAEVMGGVLGPSSGIGMSSVILQGTWVWVILEGNDENKPIIIGTITGTKSASSIGVYSGGQGFVDPDENFPTETRLLEREILRLIRFRSLSQCVLR